MLDGQRLDHLRYAPFPAEVDLIEALRRHADHLQNIGFSLSGQMNLGVAREFVDRVYTFAMLAQLDSDDLAARLAIRDCLAVAGLETWHHNDHWLIAPKPCTAWPSLSIGCSRGCRSKKTKPYAMLY